MSKKKKIIISVVSIVLVVALGVTSGVLLYKDWPDVIQDFEPKKSEETIRIMSFNIRCTNVGRDTWEDRIGIVTDTIVNSAADSVGVQEATPEWMATLKETLTDYDYVGVARDDGENVGEYSAVFYLKDKYNLLDSGTFWLSETPDTPSLGWDAACFRICTWAVLENKETKEQYVHVNSHFDHVGIKAREESVKMILAHIEKYKDLPVVFTADMNVKEGSDNYVAFTKELKDTKYLASDTMDYLTYHDTKPSKHAKDIIDYVMVNDNFNALSYKVVTAGIDERYVSDHFPVYADIEIK
ncbi:MAG: endonuclease/exonuclease/phosphatase family protein [Ruminococcaceae bacterium]|nr:endonuclease/exonuclease/phosphatase family protein [Oscillospiraceae bacterium]